MKTVLITGASGRVGTVLTRSFLENNYKVIALTSSSYSADLLADKLDFKPQRLSTFAIDLTDEHSADELLDWIRCKELNPNYLVNNARSRSHLLVSKNDAVTTKDFISELLLGIIVPYRLTQALAYARESKLQSVVNIGSQYGLVPPTPSLYADLEQMSPIHYGVAKAGLHHLTKELAIRLANKNIRVNTVAYGGIKGRTNDEFEQRYSQLCPIGRMLDDEDLYGPVELFLSEKSAAITGHTLVVDGGWTVW